MGIRDDLVFLSQAYNVPQNNIVRLKNRNDAMNVYNGRLGSANKREPTTPLADLTACLQYFRALGLTDHEIRLAITPVLFETVAKRGEK